MAAAPNRKGVVNVGSVTPKLSIAGAPELVTWYLDDPPRDNYNMLGEALGQCVDLYRRPRGHGLLRLIQPDFDVEEITTAKEFWPAIVDRLDITIAKHEGKPSGSAIQAVHLNGMLRAEQFLSHFLPVREVLRRPTYLPEFRLAERGYDNEGQYLYLGPEPEISDSTETINRFLAVMAFASEADRTNAVAAAITIMLRRHWLGGKPLVAVTATKSHAGKDTIIDFATGEEVSTGGITVQHVSWAVEQNIAGALKSRPDTGVIHLNNARLEGRRSTIESAFFERFITDPRPQLFSSKHHEPLQVDNVYVVAISTNLGSLSTDLLNRGLPIHLEPQGDVEDRASPIGNPKYKFLPENRGAIAAELRGMIERWKRAGMPLDTSVMHPFSLWAQTLGGILQVNGYHDFLGNYKLRKTSDDPKREGLAILGGHAPDVWQPAADWADLAQELGLVGRLIPPTDRETQAARQRGLGIVLSAHASETFTFQDADTSRKCRLRLEKSGRHRWTNYDRDVRRARSGTREPHHRYRFVMVEELT